MKFTKVQGAGNDFILVEAGGIDQYWPQIAIAICDRHYGIGGDGLLLLLPSVIADFQMRVFNSDGSEAEACGNGLRCFAKYALDKGLVDAKTRHISVETKAGVREVGLHRIGDRVSIQVSMGIPKFGARDIPVEIEPGGDLVYIKSVLNYAVTIGGRELPLSIVSMGNPHAVYFDQYPVSDFPLSQLGPEVEQNGIFPERTNFEVARVMSRQQIEARVWERGVGETLACGSGACAVAVIAQLRGHIDSKVDIKLPGGILNVEWDGVGEVFLSGPAEIVFSGEWPPKAISQG